MEFLHNLWKDTLSLLREPLFAIGNTDISLLRLTGLAILLLATWRLATVARRAALRLAHDGADPGVYLLSRISGYAVWAISAIIGLRYLGFELSSFAFLGGAVGVGLGFGLQNVLNNFVSGIIILLEKTLKVGDVVELQSGVMGRVAEINLRYTRITTGDMMDILVPNSEFISGRVSNWTYGEGRRRLHVPFSVASGTDTGQVREAALAAAQAVADAPERRPEVWFTGIGKNSLDFELVVWIEMASLGHPGGARSRYLWEVMGELARRGIKTPV